MAGSAGRWMRLLALLVVGLLLAIAVTAVLRSRDWAAAEHQRNYRELEIVGRAIEGWPKTIEAMARANFIKDRVKPKSAKSEDATAIARAVFPHPDLGTFTIRYGVRNCPDPAQPARPCDADFNATVIEADNRLEVRGEVPFADLAAIEGDAGSPTTSQGLIDRVLADPGSDTPIMASGKVPRLTTDALLTFATKLPLALIANLTDSAPDFETIFVVDNRGRVVANLGGRKMPVNSIEDIIAADGDLGALFLTGARVIASSGRDVGTPQTPNDGKLSLRGNAEPVSVKIAGESYIVYMRPLNFPAPWTSNCAIGNGDKASAGCQLVGLARQNDVYARSVSLSPDLLTLAAIFLTLAVALVPVMKMRFLGPAGQLSPIEVIAAIFGIVAAFALAVLAGMLVVSSLLAHAQSRMRLELAAQTMAAQFEREFGAILAQPVHFSMLQKPGGAMTEAKKPAAPGAPTKRAGLNPICNGIFATPGLAPPKPEFLLLPQQGGFGPWIWPMRETVALANANGYTYSPATRSYSNRCSSGTRLDLKDRQYFKDAQAGVGQGAFAMWQAGKSFAGFEFKPFYALGVVRSQSDANDKVLVAIPFVNEFGETESQKSGVMIQSMTLRSLLAPVLPGSAEFIVIDTADPSWPYIFGSNSRRIGIDTLKSRFGTEAAAAAIASAVRMTHLDTEAAGDAVDKAGRDKSGAANAGAANAGAANAGADIASAERAAADRASTDKPSGRIESFDAVFEGKEQQFVAVGLKGTSWVLLVHQPLREIDAPLAATASFAAAAWFGLALIAVLVFAIAWLIWRKASWLWLWPRPTLGDRARRAAIEIAVLVVVAAVIVFVPVASLAVPKVWLAVLVPTAASYIAWRHVGRTPVVPAAAVLMPRDEHGYRWLLVTLFLSFGALPMLALWNDAARATRSRSANAEIVRLEVAWKANREATRAILGSIHLLDIPALGPPVKTDPKLVATTAPVAWPEALDRVGVPGLVPGAKPTQGASLSGLSERLHAWAGLGQPPQVAGCDVDAKLPPPAEFCVGAHGEVGLVSPDIRLRSSLAGMSRPGAIAGLLAIGALLILLRLSIHALVRSLFGFGTPLEAVTYPVLSRRDKKLDLPERAVVLNGPLALQLELLGPNDALDVGQTDAQRAAASSSYASHRERLFSGGTVVVVGLEIALRDAALGGAALQMLEDMSALLDRQRRSDAGVAEGRIVVLTDLSPLDRILQAYEREQSETATSADQPMISRQQQMRWSRLFEDFTTIIFRPMPKFIWNARVERRYRNRLEDIAGTTHAGESLADGIIQLVREAHYLPEVVLNSLIDPRRVPSAATWKKLFSVTYPISVVQYGRLYSRPVWDWALSVRPATREAAIDYLRGTLIEHYQHLWVASSRAERVILDNLARGRVVNISAALALRSLIRRGLVVLDPEPRLINASFAAFVRQAERPEAMAMWRKEQGKSSWDKAALPLAILLPGAIILLAGLALMAGESFTTVFPVILGVGPALLATFGGGRKPG